MHFIQYKLIKGMQLFDTKLWDYLVALELNWRILAPGPIKVALDKYGQIGPTNWQASSLRQSEYVTFGMV